MSKKKKTKKGSTKAPSTKKQQINTRGETQPEIIEETKKSTYNSCSSEED